MKGKLAGIEEFPVYTGINRSHALLAMNTYRVPCIHRDKPGYVMLGFEVLESSLYTQG